MAETQAAPNNKLVRFRGRPTHEFVRLEKRGLISAKAAEKAAKKAAKKFAKKAGHNPPKPTYAETESNEQSNESVVETVARPVAAAAHQLEEWFGKSRKARSGRATMGIRG
jgi:hypothetical protein